MFCDYHRPDDAWPISKRITDTVILYRINKIFFSMKMPVVFKA